MQLSHVFLKKLFSVSGASSLSLIIPIIAMPLITRLCSIQAVGTAELFVMTSALLAFFASLQLEYAVVPTKDVEEVKRIINSSFAFTLILSLVLLVLSSLFLIYTFFYRDFTIYALSSFLVPVFLIQSTLFYLSTFWLLRHGQIKHLTLMKILFVAPVAVFKILFAFISPTFLSLWLAVILGQLMVVVYIYYKVNLPLSLTLMQSGWYEIAKRYKVYPLTNIPKSFLGMGKDYLLSFLITSFFGTYFLGLYVMCLKVLKTPIYALANPLQLLFFQKTVEANSSGHLPRVTNKLLIYLLLLTIPSFTILYIFAPSIIVIAFGAKWYEAGEVLRAMIPYFFGIFFVTPFELVIMTKNIQSEAFKVSILLDLVPLLLFVILLLMGKPFLFSLMWVMWLGLVGKIIYFIWLYRKIIKLI